MFPLVLEESPDLWEDLPGHQVSVEHGQVAVHVPELEEQHQVPHVQRGGHVYQLFSYRGRRPNDHVPALDHLIERETAVSRRPCRSLLPVGRPCGGPGHHALHPGPDRGLCLVARRVGKRRVQVQTPVEEVLGGLPVQPAGLSVSVGHPDELDEASLKRVRLPPQVGHPLPEAPHGGLARLIPEVGEVRVDVVHLGAPLPGLHRPTSRNPNRRMWLLDRAGPRIHVTELRVGAVKGERLLGGPGSDDQVMGLVVALSQGKRVHAVGEARIHWRAHRKTGYQTTTR